MSRETGPIYNTPLRLSFSAGHLRVQDTKSGKMIVDAQMDWETTGRFLQQHSVEAPGTIWRSEDLGKTHEHKRLFVPGLTYSTWDQRKELIEAVFAPYRDDGWYLRQRELDTLNSHRFVISDAVKGYEVGMDRYI